MNVFDEPAPASEPRSTTLLVLAVIVIALAGGVIVWVTTWQPSQPLAIIGPPDSVNVLTFWSNGAARSLPDSPQALVVTATTTAELVDAVTGSELVVALIPDGMDDATRERFLAARLIRVRAAVRPATGETLWLCCRQPADGETVPAEVAALFDYALAYDGQLDVLDVEGLDPLLPWEREMELLQLDPYRADP